MLLDLYQMPHVEEILDTLGSAKFISKVDLKKQIPICKDEMPKTAFCSPWGKFHFTVMSFGLRNGPAVFQRLMDRILHDCMNFAQAYIDDCAIFSGSWSEHCTQISIVVSKCA